ncbi:MAG: DUF4124 domain-containing protein [Gallionella sp.]|nr:DUF4124 domain-containing protein [Gallionella sp.]
MKKILLILLALTSANVFADLKKWTDADGKVHYSDQPPPANVKAKTLRTSPVAGSLMSASGVAAASAPAAPKTIAEAEAEYKKAQKAKKEAAEKAAQEQAQAEEIKTVCAGLRQNLMALESGMRTQILNAKGEPAYMDDNQRQQGIAKARQDISTYCK